MTEAKTWELEDRLRKACAGRKLWSPPATNEAIRFIGCDALREWLIAQGFRVAPEIPSRGNECNWYAYRWCEIPANACELNGGERMQVVVQPFRVEHSGALGSVWESAEITIAGESGGHWYKLMCYNLKHDELMGRLHEIEAALIVAWNALPQNEGRK